MSKLRAKKIKLLLFDVDGVLTDGKLFIFPVPPGTQQTVQQHAAQHGGEGGFGLHSQTYIEAKGFHAHDGTAISLARLGGIKTGLITKRISETVALRARDMKLEHVTSRVCLILRRSRAARGWPWSAQARPHVVDWALSHPA